jgi:hypothetical protein
MSRVARLAAAPAQHPLELKRNAATIPGSLFALGARAAAPGVRMNAFFGVMSTQACVEICRLGFPSCQDSGPDLLALAMVLPWLDAEN